MSMKAASCAFRLPFAAADDHSCLQIIRAVADENHFDRPKGRQHKRN